MRHQIQTGPARVRSATSPEKAKLSGPTKTNSTCGCCDHQAPWYEGDSWHGLSMRSSYQDDEDWYRANIFRRFRVRNALPYELQSSTPEVGLSMIVVRSRHDRAWNTIAFQFRRGFLVWDAPQSDNDALRLVGQFNPQVMLNAALLSISSRYVNPIFSGFDQGARND